MDNDPLKVAHFCKHMEDIDGAQLTTPEAEGVRTTAFVSIAISLKRIADKLDLAAKQPVIMSAEEFEKLKSDPDLVRQYWNK